VILSSIYHNKKFQFNETFWVMVYHTQPGSSEVEMVEEKFFKSEAKAWKWFFKNYKLKHFIQPEPFPVEVSCSLKGKKK
jgi:hypothetical protein